MEDEHGGCYQCGQPDCNGRWYAYCPATNIYHDASDKALAQLYPKDRTPEPEGMDELEVK